MSCLLLSARDQYPSVVLRTALETLEWVTGERLPAALPRRQCA